MIFQLVMLEFQWNIMRIMGNPFGDGLCNPVMVILGMVYFWYNPHDTCWFIEVPTMGYDKPYISR
jgi:hypothetical protein